MSFKEILRKRAIKSNDVKALKKLSIYDIMLKPLVTEKAYKQSEALNKYFFKVHKDSNKNDVKAAIKEIYGVQPKSVNFVSVPYKWRSRRTLVRRAYKKAIITLSENDKIELVK